MYQHRLEVYSWYPLTKLATQGISDYTIGFFLFLYILWGVSTHQLLHQQLKPSGGIGCFCFYLPLLTSTQNRSVGSMREGSPICCHCILHRNQKHAPCSDLPYTRTLVVPVNRDVWSQRVGIQRVEGGSRYFVLIMCLLLGSSCSGTLASQRQHPPSAQCDASQARELHICILYTHISRISV